MKTFKFSTEVNSDFATALKQRVNHYFKDSGISRNANVEMALKTTSALSLYLVPYLLLLILQPSNVFILILIWTVMGFGKSFIGTSVMHDAIHGSYTKRKPFDKLLPMCVWLLGVDPTIWRVQHNVLHHTYTNIEGVDEDLNARFVLRFAPSQKHRWFHKYQHIYAVFFYSISTITWVFLKDFIKAPDYKKRGLLKQKSYALYMLNIIARKVFYLGFFLVLPMLIIPVSPWLIAVLFVWMHLVAGTLLTIIFQLAHVMETTEFMDEKKIDVKVEENWLVHQLKTTNNFGTNSRLLFWFSGGLNHQIEHHLFPNICHIHYRDLSKIVRETAREYGITYHIEPTLFSAIRNHFRMLKMLGSPSMIH